MKPRYKLLALDLDGTTIGRNLIVSDENKNAVEEVIKQGVRVSVITGKMFAAALPIAKALGGVQYLFASNGANVFNIETNEHLIEYALDPASLRTSMQICEECGVQYRVYTRDAMYAPRESELVEEIRRDYPALPVHIGELPDTLTYVKMYARGTETNWMNPFEQVKQLHLQVHMGEDYSFEVTNSKANKGEALRYLRTTLGIHRQEVISMGNHDNDLPMFAESGFSVAVADAPAFVREKANFITKSCGDNGVSFALRQIFSL